jgi:uncharacterized protein (TIGR02246 family)
MKMFRIVTLPKEMIPMRKCLLSVALSITALISVFGQTNTSQNVPNSADESAIRALIQKCVDGWNKGSGEAFAPQFAEDSDFVPGNGMHHKGRQQNAAAHQRIFDTFFKGTRLWIQVKSVRFLKPDVALIHSVSKVLKPGESDASPEPDFIQTWVVMKRKGAWFIDAFQNTPIQRQSGQESNP